MNEKILELNRRPLAIERDAVDPQAKAVGVAVQLLDAAGKPIASGRPDPQAVALASIEHENAALRAETKRLRATVLEYELEMLVDLAIAERRVIPMLREFAMSLGRRDVAQLKAFLSNLPVLPGHGDWK